MWDGDADWDDPFDRDADGNLDYDGYADPWEEWDEEIAGALDFETRRRRTTDYHYQGKTVSRTPSHKPSACTAALFAFALALLSVLLLIALTRIHGPEELTLSSLISLFVLFCLIGLALLVLMVRAMGRRYRKG